MKPYLTKIHKRNIREAAREAFCQREDLVRGAECVLSGVRGARVSAIVLNPVLQNGKRILYPYLLGEILKFAKNLFCRSQTLLGIGPVYRLGAFSYFPDNRWVPKPFIVNYLPQRGHLSFKFFNLLNRLHDCFSILAYSFYGYKRPLSKNKRGILLASLASFLLPSRTLLRTLYAAFSTWVS